MQETTQAQAPTVLGGAEGRNAISGQRHSQHLGLVCLKLYGPGKNRTNQHGGLCAVNNRDPPKMGA